MQGFVRSGRLAILILGLAAGIAARAAAQGKTDQPVDLNASGDVEPVTGENEHALSISGFGVGGYTYDGKTNDNSFAAGKVAVALFRELTDNLYVFGQLTTSLSDEGGGEPTTETEIDNLLVSFTPKSASNVKEHRLPISLQPDVEAICAVLLLGDELGMRRVVREVDPRQLVSEQAAREHVNLDVWRLADDEREAAVGVGAAPSPTAVRGIPDLDDAVAYRHVLPVEELSDQLHSVGLVTRDELVLGTAAESDRVEGTDRLRRRARERHVSIGVPPPRPSTMSH